MSPVGFKDALLTGCPSVCGCMCTCGLSKGSVREFITYECQQTLMNAVCVLFCWLNTCKNAHPDNAEGVKLPRLGLWHRGVQEVLGSSLRRWVIAIEAQFLCPLSSAHRPHCSSGRRGLNHGPAPRCQSARDHGGWVTVSIPVLSQ